jgi:S1-C subfamily serine protease
MDACIDLAMAALGPRRRLIVIPAATVARVVGWLATHGGVARGYPGLGLKPVETDGHQSGATVQCLSRFRLICQRIGGRQHRALYSYN